MPFFLLSLSALHCRRSYKQNLLWPIFFLEEEASCDFVKSPNAILLAWVHSEGRVQGDAIHIPCEYRVVCDWINLLICFNLASLRQGWQDPCVLAAGDILYLLYHCSCLYFGNCRRESFFEPGGPDFKKQCAVNGVLNSIPKNPGLTAASSLSGTSLRTLFQQGCQRLAMSD